MGIGCRCSRRRSVRSTLWVAGGGALVGEGGAPKAEFGREERTAGARRVRRLAEEITPAEQDSQVEQDAKGEVGVCPVPA
jgi:hypothetical protein